MGNGNQKFTVPLLLTVDKPDPNPPPEPVTAPAESPSFVLVLPSEAPTPAAGEMPFADMVTAAPSPSAPLPGILVSSSASRSSSYIAVPGPAAAPARRRLPIWFHLTPLALLLMALGGVFGWDFFGPAPANVAVDPDGIDSTERLKVFFDYAVKQEKGINNSMSFGLVMMEPGKSSKNALQLTYDSRGRTNSAVAWIDGQERTFGNLQQGKWEEIPKAQGKYGGGRMVPFKFTQEQVVVTQRVEIVPGETMEVSPEVFKRLLDTCVVRYTIKNIDAKPHKVGFRFLLDTYIGGNDGTPFTIPGSTKLVTTFEDFNPANPKNKKPIPDFVQALEFEDLRKPGTIAQVNFKISDKIEPPDRVSLTNWPGGSYLPKYTIPIANIEKDSAIVMYWSPADLPSGKSREIGFSCSIGNLAAQTEMIGVTVGGAFVVNGELSVVALIADARVGQTATIEYPTGAFQPLEGYLEKQKVPQSTEKTADGRLRASPVTWRLIAQRDGTFPITVKTSDGLEATRKVIIRRSSIF
jgi:hypothetical protein